MARVIVADDYFVKVESYLERFYFNELNSVFQDESHLLLLPEKTKFAFDWKKDFYCLVEDEPQVRSISCNGKKFQIALPYVVYLASIDFGLGVFFKSKPLKSLQDKATPAILPNVFSGGFVCLGDHRYRKSDNRDVYVIRMIEAFWKSDFNMIIEDAYKRRSWFSRDFETFDLWQAASLNNPKFPLKCSWENNPYVVDFIFPNRTQHLQKTTYADILMGLPDA